MNTQIPKRLLIIDDDEDLQELFRRFMEKEGFNVAAAGDGLLGLAKAHAFNPDLIVLDLMMPNLNGFDTLHRLQKEGLGRIPVIVITGFSEQASEQVIRQEPNVVDFLSKPIKYGELTALIRRVLADR
ncbi:MAG: response regulator [Elusimicrobia bacterium]|nr:response regulator [Elusimicrobiota bacterium]